MIGEKLGHYRLTAKIGEGGMGVVYRARDEELNREVAVKVLAAGMLEHLGKDHLLKEAQTASALNHPNICTIYQIGRVDDGFYLVMELVEGQPLNEMARSTKLTTEAVTRYGVQIADALAHAHDRQIVHRDLKGANVVITHDGRVKVLDFGLARRLDKATVDAITRSLASVGARPVDRRDIALHGAGGPDGRNRRLPKRHLGAGRSALRGGHGTIAVWRQHSLWAQRCHSA